MVLISHAEAAVACRPVCFTTEIKLKLILLLLQNVGRYARDNSSEYTVYTLIWKTQNRPVRFA